MVNSQFVEVHSDRLDHGRRTGDVKGLGGKVGYGCLDDVAVDEPGKAAPTFDRVLKNIDHLEAGILFFPLLDLVGKGGLFYVEVAVNQELLPLNYCPLHVSGCYGWG